MVICDASAGSHIVMAEKVRVSDVNAVVLYDAVDIQSILNNIFIVSAAMGWNTAHERIAGITEAIGEIDEKIAGHEETRTMFPLGADKSPYV